MRANYRDICTQVAMRHDMDVETLLGTHRVKHIVKARREAFFRVFVSCPHLSYPEIGRRLAELGRRCDKFDHTTAIHSVKRYCELNGLTYEAALAMRRNRLLEDKKTAGEKSVIIMANGTYIVMGEAEALAYLAPQYERSMRGMAA